MQRAIMREALALFGSLDEPGSIVDLGYSWPEEWKEEARRPVDHRTPRYDTPQYQNEADREAAVRAHGDLVACQVCDPGAIPRS